MNPLYISDGYKQSHREQYPQNTTLVYSNFTPRSSKFASGDANDVVVFGVQAFIKKYLIEYFNKEFFQKPFDEIEKSFIRRLAAYFGAPPKIDHIKALHKLGYLPIIIKALPEGTFCPIRIPVLTIYNTKPEFFWVTNFLETILSTELWLPMTSATIAFEYKKILTKWADKTCDNYEHLSFQAHDFSMRGMAGLEAAQASGAGHLLFFSGSDTIPAIDYLEKYYNADCNNELIAVSVPATEHSVMCMGTKETEIATFKRIITETYPSGIVSIVSDTWDLWKVLTEYIPKLKNEILTRDGKVVIRPDSGNPVDIICGDISLKNKNGLTHKEYAEYKGVIELLWDTFGGTINSKGYRLLDPHIGAIYGDSITLKRAEQICERLEQKGFASSNIVFGVGSYTYQYNTRDTYGFAMKATYGEVDNIGREIFKDPVTDNGIKKSAKGLLRVEKEKNMYVLFDQQTWEQENKGELEIKFRDGKIYNKTSLSEIRNRLSNDYK